MERRVGSKGRDDRRADLPCRQPGSPVPETSSPARRSPDACTSSITIHLGERRRPVSVSVLLFGSPRDFQSGVEQIADSWHGRVEQADDEPVIRVLMYVADVKMGVVLFDHIPLVPLPEHRLPSLSVLIAPTAVRL